jgi:predicted transposase/invertase (TIGR01784 family)
MNMKENSLSHIHMVKDDLLGEQDWKGNLDILNIVMIGLAKEIPPREEKYELHRLLGTLLSQTMTAEQKLKLMKQEYDIPVDRRSIREEVKIMCNLSEGVEEMGYAKGEAAGKSEIILKMHKKGYSLEQIMDVTDMSEAEIKAIIG